MKVKVTIAEQIFRTYEIELELVEDDQGRSTTFEEWFCETEDDSQCIQDEAASAYRSLRTGARAPYAK